MKIIILTVQSTGKNKWRLGLSTDDSITLFKHKEMVKFELPNNIIFSCSAVCGTSKKKAFDFSHGNLNQWILDNKFYCYLPYKPTKIEFALTTEMEYKTLTFLKVQKNKTKCDSTI